MYPKVHLYSGNNCGSLTCEGFDDQVPYYLSPSSPDYRGFDLNFNTTEGTVYWVAFELTDPVDYSFSALSSYGWHFAYTFYAEALAPPASLVNVAISDVVVTIVAKGVGDGTAIDSLDVDGAPCRNAVYTEGLAFSTTIECELDAAFDEGGLFQCVFHPFVIGYRSRIWILDQLIAHARSRGPVWFATHRDVAHWVRTTCA